MQVALLIAIVTAVTCSESAPHVPAAHAPLRFSMAFAAMGLTVLTAYLISMRAVAAVRSMPAQTSATLARFERLQRWHAGLWIVVVAIVLSVVGWPQLVRYNCQLEHVILVRDVTVLLPVWLPWLLSWAVFYDVERSLTQISASSQRGGTPFDRARFVWLQARHWLGLLVVPMLAVMAIDQLVTTAFPQWSSQPHSWWLYLVAIAGVVLVFPLIIARLWNTSPMPPSESHRRLTATCRRFGVRCRGIRIWNTDQRILNAAVTGILPRVRFVFLTDALVHYLPIEEVEAILVHELGHIRRHHLQLRLLLLGLPVWIVAWAQTLGSTTVAANTELMTLSFTDPGGWTLFVVPLLITCYTILALGWYSRFLELDADACVATAGMTSAFVRALHRLNALNGTDQGKTWLHPAINERVRRLLLAELEPTYRIQLRRRARCLAIGLVALWLAVPLVVLAC